MRDVFAFYDHGASRGLDKAGDRSQRSGLTAAGRAEERIKLSFLHVDIDIFQRCKVAEPNLDVVKLDHNLIPSICIIFGKAGSRSACRGIFPARYSRDRN